MQPVLRRCTGCREETDSSSGVQSHTPLMPEGLRDAQTSEVEADRREVPRLWVYGVGRLGKYQEIGGLKKRRKRKAGRAKEPA